MAMERHDASLQVLFGKAFLIQLERGDVETARVFARAFLARTGRSDSPSGLTLRAA
jgi:hypothetical protein